MQCPCGSKKEYEGCCGPLIEGVSKAETPEALMRSRYTAYTLANIAYIANTMKGNAAEGFDPVSAEKWAKSVKWLKLKVSHAVTEGDTGWVEFIATFEEKGMLKTLHERSEFERIEGTWFYMDGFLPPKIGRNDPCFCGSGKKYKKCCFSAL